MLSWGWKVALAAIVLLSARVASAEAVECLRSEAYELDNGLEVVLQPDHELPLVAVMASVDVGARHSPKGYQGLAHYTEHLLFRGKTPETGVISRYRKLGATRINGTTSLDATNYFALVPAEQLEGALWIEARRFAVGVSEVTPEQAEDEAEVVRREFNLRAQGYFHDAQNAILSSLHGEGHPYDDALTTHASLGELSLDRARWFHEQMYGMDRTRLVLVGDFDAKRAKSLIEKYWSGLRSSATPKSALASRSDLAHTFEPPERACRFRKRPVAAPPARMKLRTPWKPVGVEIWWPVPPEVNVHELRRVLALAAGPALTKSRDLRLVSTAAANAVDLSLSEHVVLSFQLHQGQDWKPVEAMVWEELSSFADEGASEDELAAAYHREELEEELKRPQYLDRAHELAERHCEPRRCEPRERLTREHVLELARHLNRSQSMTLHSEYDFGTVGSGPQAEILK